MKRKTFEKGFRKVVSIASSLALILAAVLVGFSVPRVLAAELTGGSLSLSDSTPSQTSVTYTADWNNVTTSAIKCIQLKFNTAADGSGTAPTGMTTTSAAFGGTSDYIPTPASWAVDAALNGTVKITYATGEAPALATNRTVVLTGITNGSTADTAYYLIFNTYNNADCSTSGVDNGTITFIFTTGQAVSLSVDPTLSFTIAGVASAQTVNGATTNITTTATTIPLGTVTTSTNGIGAHDLTVSTNAGSGYTVFTRYSAVPTNAASDTITDHTGTNASPTSFSAAGTEAFGYTTNDATLGTGTTDRFTAAPGNKWAAFTTSNLEVAYNAAAVSTQTTRTGYQTGIAATTEPGSYTTTLTFTATPAY